MAERQAHKVLVADPRATRLPDPGRHAGERDRPRGCSAGPDPDMGRPHGDGAPGPAMASHDPAMVHGSRICRAQRRWRGHRRRLPAHAATEGAPARPALSGSADALATVETSKASLASKLCLRFLVLTAARSGEARGATWNEIHLDAVEWRIPGERRKSGEPHRVPLSDAAIAVLEQARPLRDESVLIFPSSVKPGHPMSDMTLTQVLQKTGLVDRATVHGFQSAFRDWAAECTSAPRAVMELSLAHAVGSSVEQAYARSDLIEKRRALMQQWADFLTSAAVFRSAATSLATSAGPAATAIPSIKQTHINDARQQEFPIDASISQSTLHTFPDSAKSRAPDCTSVFPGNHESSTTSTVV